MLKPPARVLRPFCLLIFGLGLLAGSARADLVWTSQTGWRIEGGLLSGLTGTEGRAALDLMNDAREAEEKNSLRRAAKIYEKVARKYPHSIYAPEALYRAGRARLEDEYLGYHRWFRDHNIRVPEPEWRAQYVEEVIGLNYTTALGD